MLTIRFVHWAEKSRNRTIASGKTPEEKFGDSNNNKTDNRLYDFCPTAPGPQFNLWICSVYDRSNVYRVNPSTGGMRTFLLTTIIPSTLHPAILY